MTKFVKILSLVLALCLLVCGCAGEPKEKVVTCGELNLTMSASYVDLSDQDYATGLDFVYGSDDEAVLVISESRAPLESYYPGLNAEKYAMLFAETNQYDCQVGKLGDLVTFTYEATADGTSLTYLCGVFMSEENFWCVQFYCPTEAFANNQSRFMGYLQATTVSETLTNQ